MTDYEISGLPIDLSAQLDAIKPGAQWGFGWNVYDTNEVLENTTGWAVSCQFRETPESGTVLVTLSVGSGITNDNGGTFNLTLTPAQTTTFKVEQVYFDIYVTDDADVVECLFQGIVPVIWRATRS